MKELDYTIYAIRNIRTGKFITGTDRRNHPYRQIMSKWKAPMLFMGYELESEFMIRQINSKTYQAVKVKIVEDRE